MLFIGALFITLFGQLVDANHDADYHPAILTKDDVDVANFPLIAFPNEGSASSRGSNGPRCKIGPQDAAWPTTEEWNQLNKSIDGRLLKPVPAPIVCYSSQAQYNPASCDFLTSGRAKESRFWLDDPLSVLSPWTEGSTCLPINSNTTTSRSCEQGGFPVYVVNATEVKHVQAAVNFARNKNIRLNVKNTGHDFLGRSNGYGSLSIWTHHMKEIRYLPEFVVASYQGAVVRLGAGVETWEANKAMIANNITFLVPKLPTQTVGVAGGWFLGGGHANLASMYGLGADRVVMINFVTADGKYLTATEDHHPEWFFALRGGGGSTFAIVTSVYLQAFPGLVTLGTASFGFTAGPNLPSTLQNPTANVSSTDKFWTAVGLYLSFAKSIVDSGGFGHGDVANNGNNSFSFSAQFIMPRMSAAETLSFIEPLFDSFRAQGINIITPVPAVVPYAEPGNGTNTAPGLGTFSSRLIPRSNWDNSTILSSTVSAIRQITEGGFSVRTRAYSPSLKAAGQHAAQAVSPFMRNMVLHTTVFSASMDVALLPPKQLMAALQQVDDAVGVLRKVTPNSGAYFNEAGVLEPNWQESFWGRENYKRLAKFKKEVDPLGVFWARMTVGSEGWRVEEKNGLPTNDGPLCRVDV